MFQNNKFTDRIFTCAGSNVCDSNLLNKWFTKLLSAPNEIRSFNAAPGSDFKPAQFTFPHSGRTIQYSIILPLSTN